MTVQYKKCKCCNKLLPLTNEYWSKNKRYKDGYFNKCKSCSKPDKLYRKWIDMKSRCLNPSSCNYLNYGARGISICEEWLHNYKSFESWAIQNGYNPKLSIDRINNDGNYEPSNCRWTTKRVQNINKRPTSPNTSGYVGIRKHTSGIGWYGSVKVNNKDYFTGYSKDLREAVIMRNKYIKEHNLDNQINEVRA
jgi:hypothetical protein